MHEPWMRRRAFSTAPRVNGLSLERVVTQTGYYKTRGLTANGPTERSSKYFLDLHIYNARA